MKPSIEAVIFDLDGLLVDSEPLQGQAWHDYLATLGATLTPEVLERMLGTRLIDASRTVVEAFGLDMQPEKVARERDEFFLAMVPGNIAPHSGARELVAELVRRGLPFALATSGHRRYVDLVLESAEIPRVFTVEVTGDMVKRGKPDPETFLTAASLLGVQPERCLVLEDAPFGIQAAKAARMTCLAIPNEHTRNLDLSVADGVLGSLNDVIPWLDDRQVSGT